MKQVYEKPSCEQLEFSAEGVFCASGETMRTVTGEWEEDTEF